MDVTALLLIVLAHFISDFPLQFEKLVKLRSEKDKRKLLKGNALHSIIHLLVLCILTINYLSLRMILINISIAISHFVIDYVKSVTRAKAYFREHCVSFFLLDQVLHLFCIITLFCIINIPVYEDNLLSAFTQESKASFLVPVIVFSYIQKVIISLILIVLGLWGVGVFIRIVLEKLSSTSYKEEVSLKLELIRTSTNLGAPDGGFIIGILERLFTIIAIVLNMPLMIGFILTVKSVARLKKFDDERFVEIFIIGSFISFISAVIAGYIIRLMKIIPY